MSCYMNWYQLTAQDEKISTATTNQRKPGDQVQPNQPKNVESLSILLWGNAYHGRIRCSTGERLGRDGNHNPMPLFRLIRFPNFFPFFSH